MIFESAERKDARAAVEKAVLEYTRCVRTEAEDEDAGDDPVVVGWVVAVEYTSMGMEREDLAGTLRVTPEGQARSMSIGLLVDSREKM